MGYSIVYRRTSTQGGVKIKILGEIWTFLVAIIVSILIVTIAFLSIMLTKWSFVLDIWFVLGYLGHLQAEENDGKPVKDYLIDVLVCLMLGPIAFVNSHRKIWLHLKADIIDGV